MQHNLDMRQQIEELENIPERVRSLALERVELVEQKLGEVIESALEDDGSLQTLFEIDQMEEDIFSQRQFIQFLMAAIFHSVTDCKKEINCYNYGTIEEDYYILDLEEPYIRSANLLCTDKEYRKPEELNVDCDFVFPMEDGNWGYFVTKKEYYSQDLPFSLDEIEMVDFKERIENLTNIPEIIKKMALRDVDRVEAEMNDLYNTLFFMYDEELLEDALALSKDDYDHPLSTSQFNQILVGAIFFSTIDCCVRGNQSEFGMLENNYYVMDIKEGTICKAELVYVADDPEKEAHLIPPYEYESSYWDLKTYYFNSIDEKRLLHADISWMN